jgi:type I restriction enzyme M protein
VASSGNETETVIKRILPYLRRRGYDPETDFTYEESVDHPDRYAKGYIDILVNAGKTKPLFLIEAKRTSKRLSTADRAQAVGYGKATGVMFTVLTNGQDIQIFNATNGQPIRWDGKLSAKIPRKDQLSKVISTLKANKGATDISLASDSSLPFREALPLKQLNALFYRCHSKIRSIEKNEEHAFADFSKILFLKLLEEKSDTSDFSLPYSYRFHELAEKPAKEADQVRDAITKMLDEIKRLGYGDVLVDPLHLKQPATFSYLVGALSRVSFTDSGLDTKGAAFEYFVRATLKGKRLGQYFTPRALVELMCSLVGSNMVVGSLSSGASVKVLDPACGTGGFLVYMMKESLTQVDQLVAAKRLTKAAGDRLRHALMERVFHGADANDSVASTAKMNMIIAGDGHTNIKAEDSLQASSSIWSFETGDYDLIMTNPPFGTSESASLSNNDLANYPIRSAKGQILFLQRMVLATRRGGLICTVIDEGVLNTDGASSLRRWLFEKTQVLAVVRLPDETFKPNKITVRTSVLMLRRREYDDVDLGDNDLVTFCDLSSLGYIGSGDRIRGFDSMRLRNEFGSHVLDRNLGTPRSGYHWRAADVPSREITADPGCRLDYKYWEPAVRRRITDMMDAHSISIRDVNALTTGRGKSPPADLYVDEADGYAMVVKSGTNISRFGEIVDLGADWIEKSVFDEIPSGAVLQWGDVVLASTGEGTLGKAAVYDSDVPAIADGHVTVVRIRDTEVLNPWYLADYLRCGFGNEQIQRLFTGSTGLIELTPEHVNSIVVPLLGGIEEQQNISRALRSSEGKAQAARELADGDLAKAQRQFRDWPITH